MRTALMKGLFEGVEGQVHAVSSAPASPSLRKRGGAPRTGVDDEGRAGRTSALGAVLL